jgi:hypothetical protein
MDALEHKVNNMDRGGVMNSNDEIAEEAHRLAKERAFTARRFLGVLDHGYYTNIDAANVPAAERDLLLPALRGMVNQRGGTVRLNAARALIDFGDPVGWEVLIACLQSDDSALRGKTLMGWTAPDGIDVPE